MSTEWTAIISLFDPVLDAFRMEEMLVMAIQPSDKLFVFEVLPADYALFFAVIEASSELELRNRPQH